MPICSVAPSGTRSAMNAAILWSSSPGTAGGTSTSGRSTWHQPASSLMCTMLPPIVRGIRSLTSR